MQLRKGCRLWWIVPPIAALDRVTKLLAQRFLSTRGAMEVIPGLLSWDYTRNRGAAFSLLYGRSLLLILLSLLLVGVLLVWLIRNPGSPTMERIGLWCIIAGGLGNLWDRLVFGYVIDFIRLDFIRFPVFNGADIFVCGGCALLIISILISERRKAHG